jgi:hypothetical protein
VGLTGSSSLSSPSSVSTEGLAFFFAGAWISFSSSSSPPALSSTFGNEIFDLCARPLGAVTEGCLEDDLLDGGFATFSFSSAAGSSVEPRLRFAGNVSAETGSTEALVEREDRLGGIRAADKGKVVVVEIG